MKLRTCLYNLTFEPNPNLRRSLFELEDTLKGYTTPFTLISVPNDAPLNFPRIIASTNDGQTQLSVSLQNAQIVTNYAAGDAVEFSDALAAMRDRASLLFSALTQTASTVKPLFSGVTTAIQIEGIADGAPEEYIANWIGAERSSFELDDASVKFVYKHEGKYYLNITMRKAMDFDGPISADPTPEVFATGRPSLAVELDFNTRLAYNLGKLPAPDAGNAQDLFELIDRYVKNGLDRFVANGEFVL